MIVSHCIRQCRCPNLNIWNYFNVSKDICWFSGYFSGKPHTWPHRTSTNIGLPCAVSNSLLETAGTNRGHAVRTKAGRRWLRTINRAKVRAHTCCPSTLKAESQAHECRHQPEPARPCHQDPARKKDGRQASGNGWRSTYPFSRLRHSGLAGLERSGMDVYVCMPVFALTHLNV